MKKWPEKNHPWRMSWWEQYVNMKTWMQTRCDLTREPPCSILVQSVRSWPRPVPAHMNQCCFIDHRYEIQNRLKSKLLHRYSQAPMPDPHIDYWSPTSPRTRVLLIPIGYMFVGSPPTLKGRHFFFVSPHSRILKVKNRAQKNERVCHIFFWKIDSCFWV